MGKKWYNFFVVSEEHGEDPAVPEPSPLQTPAATPRRVLEMVSDVARETTFDAPVTTPTTMDGIYRSAQIPTPAHGYTVLKVAEMLQSEHIRTLPVEVKRKSIMVALDAAGVKVNEVIEDAVRRDRALDTYERVLQKHIEDLRSQKELENKRLQEEINQRLTELRAHIEENTKEVNREHDNLTAWRTRKREEEEKIAETVSHFVSENPITTATAPAKEKGEADHVR